VASVAGSLCLSAVAADLPFTDVKTGAWYESAVETVYTEGIMEGKAEGKFEPNSPMTRAELVTVLCRLSGDSAEGKGEKLSFSDTKKNSWYADSVAWAAESGIVAGYEDNTFKPNAPVLRCELAKMFVTFLEYMKITEKGTALVDSFTDADSFPKWAAGYIESLRETGLMGGDDSGAFKPKSNASRAEIATVITRLLPMMEDADEGTENSSPKGEIIKDKVSNYTLVYDNKVDAFTNYLCDEYLDFRMNKRVKITMYGISQLENVKGRRIIFGSDPSYAEPVLSELDPAGDFAIRYVDGDIIVCTNDESLYPFLIAVFDRLILSTYADGNLIIDDDFDFVYSKSDVYGMSYLEYAVKNGAVRPSDLYEIFKGYEFTDSKGMKIMYRIYTPFDYSEDKEYPVLLYLHPNTGQGSDNAKQLGSVGPYFYNADSPAIDSIVVVPQCPEPYWWGNVTIDAVAELLDYVNENYSTDKSRQYVAGISMGGSGTWDMILRYPDKVSAALPVAGGGLSVYPNPDGSQYVKYVPESLLDIPLCMVYDNDDPTIPGDFCRMTYDAIVNAGGKKIIRVETNGYGHDICGKYITRDDISLVEWLYDQRRETK